MPAMTDVTLDYTQQQDEKQSLSEQALYPDQLWLPPSMSASGLSESDSTIALPTDSSTSLNSLPGVSSGVLHGPFPSPVSSIVADLDQSMYIAPYSDVKDSNAVQGVCGLRNLGNTCFINSGLQCLISNPRLARFFLDVFDMNIEVKDTMTGHFARLMSKTWCGHFSMLYPSEFKQVLGMYHPQFSDYRQHDCQEFLALVLDNFHEQLNTSTISAKQQCNSPSTSIESSDKLQCTLSMLEGATSSHIDQSDTNYDDEDVVSAIPEVSNAGNSAHSSPVGLTLSDSPLSLAEGAEPLQMVSEDSNLSIVSHSSDNGTRRIQPMPQGVKPFSMDQPNQHTEMPFIVHPEKPLIVEKEQEEYMKKEKSTD